MHYTNLHGQSRSENTDLPHKNYCFIRHFAIPVSTINRQMLCPQVLVASSDNVCSWVNKDDTTGVPVGAVTGGCSPEGSRNYVIRVKYNWVVIPGNYEEGNDYVEFEHYGYKCSVDWEYLVSNEDVAGMSIILIFMIYSIITGCRC